MPSTQPTLFTIGYSGRQLPDFIRVLSKAGVKRVIDVRELPLSRRPGFSKTKLNAALDAAGIEYVHLRDAGNPFRKEAAEDIKRCLKLYRDHLKRRPDVIDMVRVAASEKASALLCVEEDAACCHRSVVAELLLSAGTGFDVRNL